MTLPRSLRFRGSRPAVTSVTRNRADQNLPNETTRTHSPVENKLHTIRTVC